VQIPDRDIWDKIGYDADSKQVEGHGSTGGQVYHIVINRVDSL
jgi:hypothetical protein